MLQQVCNSFSDLYPHAFSMYGYISLLVYTMDQKTVILESQEGVHQGDPWVPLCLPLLYNLYCLRPINDMLEFILWLNVFLIGPPKETVNAFQELQVQFESAGLLVSKQKCEP